MTDIVRITNLSGGLMTDPRSYMLRPNEFQALKNFFIRGVEEKANLRLREGIYAFMSFNRDGSDGGAAYYLGGTAKGEVLGFTRYRNPTSSKFVAGVGSCIIAVEEDTGVAGIIWAGGSGLLTKAYEFAQMLGYLFWVDENSQAMMWDGVLTTGPVGITPPNRALVESVSDYSLLPGGNLDSYNKPDYRWVMTYVSADGIESNPSPEGLSVEVLQKTMSFDAGTIPVSSDPRVATKNIYRIGGNLSVYTLVGTIANSELFFEDDVADIDAGPALLSYNHDQPPARGEEIIVWKNRLCISQGYTLAVSSLGEPWYFPTQIVDSEVDGRIFDVDSSYENPIVGLALSGSALLIACRKSFHLLMGDTADTYSLVQVADIGCAAKRSLVQCGNITMWLAPDGMVYAMGESGPTPMARDIERTLKGIPTDTFPDACATYFNRQYHICIPQGPGSLPYYFVYDFNFSRWVDLSEYYTAATMLYSETGVSDERGMLFATESGYTKVDGDSFTGIMAQFAAAPTSPAVGSNAAFEGVQHLFDFDAWTGDIRYEQPEIERRVVSLRLRGSFSGESGSLVVYATKEHRGPNPYTTTVERSYALISGTGVLLDRDGDSALVGNRINFRLRGQATTMEWDDLAVGLADVRKDGR